MKLGLCLMSSALVMALAGCQSESKPPAAAGQAAVPITLNAAEPAEPGGQTADNQAAAPEAPPAPEADEASGLTRDFLMHQKFVLVRVNEADYSSTDQNLPVPTLEFGDDFQVGGRICNLYHGQGELQDDVLIVRAVASTRMLCPDTNLVQLETLFFNMLESGATLSMDGDRLSLKQGGNSLVFKARSGS